MKPSMVRKADRIAKDRTPKPRMHFFWWGLDATYDMDQARIRARIASGKRARTIASSRFRGGARRVMALTNDPVVSGRDPATALSDDKSKP